MKNESYKSVAWLEFILIVVFAVFCYLKIKDGTIQIDKANIFRFNDKITITVNPQENDEKKEKIVEIEVKKIKMTPDEMYALAESKYEKALPFMYSSLPMEFKTLRSEDGYCEILNYEEVMNSIFTKEAIIDWEKNHVDLMKKENGKVYIMAADGVIGLDYITRSFTKFECEGDTIRCVVDNIFYKDIFDHPDDYLMPEVKHVESIFELKNVDGTWLINKIGRARTSAE